MTGLKDFSVRGLRRFQTILLATGLLLFPIVLTFDSTLLYGFSTIAFITLFLGFRKAEQLVGRKVKAYQVKQLEKLYTLKQECEELVQEMKEIFQKKGYSTRLEDNAMLKNLSLYFNKCSSIQDYEAFKNVLNKRKAFVSGLQYNHEKTEEKRTAKPEHSYTSGMSPYFKTLGLPDGTTDMVVIKKAYKKLIKENHPDVNIDKKAGSKTVEINLAYKKLKEHIEVS